MYKPDPGPCPVDDAPHTTCVAPEPAPAAAPAITAVLLPARDGVVAPRRVTVLGSTPGAFSTRTYRRPTRTP